MGPSLDRMSRTFPKALDPCPTVCKGASVTCFWAWHPPPPRAEMRHEYSSSFCPACRPRPSGPMATFWRRQAPASAWGLRDGWRATAGRATATAHLLLFCLPSTPPAFSGGFCSSLWSQVLPTGALPSLTGPFICLTLKPFPPESRPSSRSWEREARLCSCVCPQLALNIRQVTLTASASIAPAGRENRLPPSFRHRIGIRMPGWGVRGFLLGGNPSTPALRPLLRPGPVLMSSASALWPGCGRPGRRKASAAGQGLDPPPTRRAPSPARLSPASHLPTRAPARPRRDTERALKAGLPEACFPFLHTRPSKEGDELRGFLLPSLAGRLRTAEQEAIWGRMGAVRRRQPPEDPFRRRLPPSSASRLNCGVRIDWECKWQLKCNLHSQQEWGGGEGTGWGDQDTRAGRGPRGPWAAGGWGEAPGRAKGL